MKFEVLEDRDMLAPMADIVFLIDNSSSDGHVTTHWIRALVSGDTDFNGEKDSQDVSERLAAQGVTDVRYGLVAFGEVYSDSFAARFAHSEVVDTDTTKSVHDRLFSSGVSAADHIADLKTALTHLDSVQAGGTEDGWDAIDHAIAEYDFRPGAVPIFVLVHNEDGRAVEGGSIINQNASLTHENCSIFNNFSSLAGGGLYFAGASGSALILKSTPISDNTCGGIGGGLYMEASEATVTIENSTISGNTGGVGSSLHRKAA